ncbi:MAG TPA: flagellar protein FliT [Burkholderiaceae bacterium]|nr:flagellar protein FliT [Burkholderiaceae bacterium]
MNARLDILSRYQAIAEISGRMLTEARANRWDAVVALGEQYTQAVETLREINTLSLEDREARKELLTQILDDDANIRRLAMPELERLSGLLGNVKRQHRVLRTYSGTLA